VAKVSEPVFSVTLDKGLADRHRLPIGQVISVLTEIRQMITETGRAIQKQRGLDSPPLDFGLEVLAEDDGRVFSKGSFRARIAITNHIEIGVEAAERVISLVYDLGSLRKPPMRLISSEEPLTAKIVNHLDRMAFIHERSHAEAKFKVTIPKAFKVDASTKARTAATFGSNVVKRLAALREPVFTEDDVTLYGKLTQLKDRTFIERDNRKFWGELRRDNGEVWRIQFEGGDESVAKPLFRQQVRISGDAFYFQTRTPKLIASEVVRDEQRDYLGAFDELVGANKAFYNADLRTILARRYGED